MLTRTNGLFSDILCLQFFHHTSNTSCDFSKDQTIHRHILSSLYIAIIMGIATMTIKINELKKKIKCVFWTERFYFHLTAVSLSFSVGIKRSHLRA